MHTNDIVLQIGAATLSVPAHAVVQDLLRTLALHPDDAAVDRFAAALKAKLATARTKGRGGWDDPQTCPIDQLAEQLVQHIAKGDPLDVGAFAMMLQQRGAGLAVLPAALNTARIAASTAPRIGAHWTEQGGTYAGVVRGDEGQQDYHLIIADQDDGETKSIDWGAQGEDEPTAKSDNDGHANTLALCRSAHDHPAAEWAAGLDLAGFNDWYLPARNELRIAYANCKCVFAEEWYWSSTQCSRYNAWFQHFLNGDQSSHRKGYEARARAVRRLIIE